MHVEGAALTPSAARSSPVPLVAPDAANAPSRLIGRFIAEVQLAAVAAVVEALETHCGRSVAFDRATVLMVIMRAGPHFHCASVGDDAPGDPNAAISINAVAASLNRPFETVRRHVNALIAADVCLRTPRGIRMQPDIAALPALHRAVRQVHDLMVMLIGYAHRHGITLPAARPGVAYQPGATIAATLDLILAAAEYLHDYYADWMEMAIVNAVIAANARTVTFDPQLAHRYAFADTVPPESLRIPVAVAEIARALRIPYSTVQRQANRSIARGQLKRVTGGVMITTEFLEASAVRDAGPVASSRAMRAFGRLVPGGFPFDRPESCYIDGPPPLLDFGDGAPAVELAA